MRIFTMYLLKFSIIMGKNVWFKFICINDGQYASWTVYKNYSA